MAINIRKKNIFGALLVLLVILKSVNTIIACDTWVALRNATRIGYTILAKNSDRPLADCQPLMFYPRKQWPSGSKIDLGRITIPQLTETFATLGSSPYWCWGYEEGMNEYGVAIGNEGVFSKDLVEKIAQYKGGKKIELGPTGMDLVRLGLERGKTAQEALEVITGLLEEYGQFGAGVPAAGIDGAYDNSFIIADPNEAWVLETAGRHWIARLYSKDVTSISNKLSITTEWNKVSSELIEYAVKRGWWPGEKKDEFNFEKAFIDDTQQGKARSYRSRVRQNCSGRLLEENMGDVTVDWMKRIARDRSTNPSIDLDQTASSCVAILSDDPNTIPIFWWCAATPSSSCYIPFFVHGSKLPSIVSTAGTFGRKIIPPSQTETDRFSLDSFWWLFRDLCDKTNLDWDTRNPIVREEFDELEKDFAQGLPALIKKAVSLRTEGDFKKAAELLDSYTSECVDKTVKKVNELRERFAAEDMDVPEKFKPFVGTYIANFGQYQGAEFKVLARKDRLAVHIPGQSILDLKDPDEEGLWYLVLTNRVAVSFVQNKEGIITALKFHEANIFPRKKGDTEEISTAVPKEFQPYLGKYSIPMQKDACAVIFKEGRLAVDIPNQIVVELNSPDNKDRWGFSIDPTTSVSFVKNREGNVTAMRIHQEFSLPKKEKTAE